KFCMFSFIVELLDISATSCNRISEFLRTCTFLFKRKYNTVILLHPFYNITKYFVTKKGYYTIHKHKKHTICNKEDCMPLFTVAFVLSFVLEFVFPIWKLVLEK